jgi:iron complex outermembrane recepter protein
VVGLSGQDAHAAWEGKMNKTRIVLTSTVMMTLAPSVCWAQATASPGAAAQPTGESPEIVVTGLKRNEKFINAPVSVQVFTEETIAKAGVTRPQDFLNLTSNVTFIQTNHAGEAFVNVRGQASVRQAESAVAVVIDGVQLATQNEFNGELFDIAQIEVLKGPQSALYGRNATAGAIIITTKAPTNDLGGSVTASYGNWNSMKISGGLGGAIVPDKLLFRVSASLSDSDGPFTNINSGEKVMRSSEKVGRLRFDYKSGDFRADFRLNGSQLKGGGIAATPIAVGAVVAGVPILPTFTVNDYFRIPYIADVAGYNRQDKWSTSLKMDYDFDFGTLTSVTSYNYINDDYGAKNFPYANYRFPGTNYGPFEAAFGNLTQNYRIRNTAFTQELRLASKADGAFRWMIGAYYLSSQKRFIAIQGQNASGVIAPGFDIQGPASQNPTVGYDNTRYTAENFAPFANVQIDITRALELSVAGRYDTEKRTARTLTPDTINPLTSASYNNCVRALAVPASQCFGSQTFKAFQPKVSLTYKAEGLGSIFASYGRGFKSGGFNPIGTRAVTIAAFQAAGLPTNNITVQDAYGKEVSDAYEIGFKSRLFNRHVDFNGAVFMTDINGAQQFEFSPISGIQSVSPVDKVRIKGFELEATVRPISTLQIFASYGYIDSKVRKYTPNPAFVGNRTPYSSNYTINAGFQWNPKLTDAINGNVRFDFNRSGPMWFDVGNQINTERNAVSLANLRVGIGADRWELTLWSKNLFNEIYSAEAVPLVGGLLQAGFRGFPRSFGVEGRIKF